MHYYTMLKFMIFFLIAICSAKPNLDVEKHIVNRILENSAPNKTEILNVLRNSDYLGRIKRTYERFNVKLDESNVMSLWAPYFPMHGYYCGFYNSYSTNIIPYDEIDLSCQIYKVCTESIEYTSCFCNRQLYHNLLSNNVVDNRNPKLKMTSLDILIGCRMIVQTMLD